MRELATVWETLLLSPDSSLIAQFLNITVNVVLIAWTIRFTTRRLERYRPPAAA